MQKKSLLLYFSNVSIWLSVSWIRYYIWRLEGKMSHVFSSLHIYIFHLQYSRCRPWTPTLIKPVSLSSCTNTIVHTASDFGSVMFEFRNKYGCGNVGWPSLEGHNTCTAERQCTEISLPNAIRHLYSAVLV